MKKHNHHPNYLFTVLVILTLAITACIASSGLSPTQAAPPAEQPTEAPIDRIATGVVEAKDIAATLTAGVPLPIQTYTPVISPSASMTVTAGVSYGPTQHCLAKSGFATIELRNIVPNVKYLDLIVDNVRAATVDYGKYGCIYLADGLHYFQWKNESEQKQSNSRSFTINGSDGWYSGSIRSDGIRNPYDAWLDSFIPSPTPTPKPTPSPTPTP